MTDFLAFLACCAIVGWLGFMAGCRWTEAMLDGVGEADDADEYKVGGTD